MGATILSVQTLSIPKSKTNNNSIEGPLVYYSAPDDLFFIIGRVKNAVATSTSGWKSPDLPLGSTGFLIQYEGPKPTISSDELYIFTVKANYTKGTQVEVEVNEEYHSGPKIGEQPRRKTKIIVTDPF